MKRSLYTPISPKKPQDIYQLMEEYEEKQQEALVSSTNYKDVKKLAQSGFFDSSSDDEGEEKSEQSSTSCSDSDSDDDVFYSKRIPDRYLANGDSQNGYHPLSMPTKGKGKEKEEEDQPKKERWGALFEALNDLKGARELAEIFKGDAAGSIGFSPEEEIESIQTKLSTGLADEYAVHQHIETNLQAMEKYLESLVKLKAFYSERHSIPTLEKDIEAAEEALFSLCKPFPEVQAHLELVIGLPCDSDIWNRAAEQLDTSLSNAWKRTPRLQKELEPLLDTILTKFPTFQEMKGHALENADEYILKLEKEIEEREKYIDPTFPIPESSDEPEQLVELRNRHDALFSSMLKEKAWLAEVNNGLPAEKGRNGYREGNGGEGKSQPIPALEDSGSIPPMPLQAPPSFTYQTFQKEHFEERKNRWQAIERQSQEMPWQQRVQPQQPSAPPSPQRQPSVTHSNVANKKAMWEAIACREKDPQGTPPGRPGRS